MQFKLHITEYSREGALTNITHAEYFDSIDRTEQAFRERDREYWYDEEGQKTTIKRFKVVLQVETYKTIDDPDAFFEQFRA